MNDIQKRARELLAVAAGGCSALPIRRAPHLDNETTVSVAAALRAIEHALSSPPNVGEALCSDCPPGDYPTDETRCLPCPRRSTPPPDMVKVLEEALTPFAKMGQMLDGPFGPALFRDDQAIGLGGAWKEDGETRTITFGDLRRARAALASLKDSSHAG